MSKPLSATRCIFVDRKSTAKFKHTLYKLCCSATPSPNDLNEIGNHSEFLNVLDAQDMRSKWFVREDGMNNYRLKGHAKADFYGWIASWAIVFENPADIGFIETGKRFKLPPLNYITHMVETVCEVEQAAFFHIVFVASAHFNCIRQKLTENVALLVLLNPNQNLPLGFIGNLGTSINKCAARTDSGELTQ